MKKCLFILVLTAYMVSGCGKSKESGALKYNITGLKELTLDNPGIVSLPIQVEYISGKTKQVILSATGVPSNALVTFSPAAGTPPYSSTINIEWGLSKSGSHTIGVTGTTVSGAATTYDTRINVKPNCSAELTGVYEGNGCNNGQVLTTITSIPDSPAYVRIKGLPFHPDLEEVVFVNCKNKSYASIGQTQISSYVFMQVSGSFGFDDKHITLKYREEEEGQPRVLCEITLTRKK